MRVIENHGLVVDGHDTARADVLAAARAFLVAGGVPAAEADDATVDRPGLVARAWWSDTAGFVQPDHAGAVAVTVVNVVPAQ